MVYTGTNEAAYYEQLHLELPYFCGYKTTGYKTSGCKKVFFFPSKIIPKI